MQLLKYGQDAGVLYFFVPYFVISITTRYGMVGA